MALQYAKGLTDKEVADALCKSYHTVRVQKRAIYDKLGISKDTELLWWLICRKTGIPFSLSEVRKYGLIIIDRYGLHRCGTALGDLRTMNSKTFGFRFSEKIVGGRARLERLIIEGKVRAEKGNQQAQNGKWLCNAADVLFNAKCK